MAKQPQAPELPKRDPDTTPKPGGGSWRWDESTERDGALGDWVEVPVATESKE